MNMVEWLEMVDAENTDRDLWESDDGRVFVTENGIGIEVGGVVNVRPVREWHRLVMEEIAAKAREGEAT